jgi:hypothetical protein
VTAVPEIRTARAARPSVVDLRTSSGATPVADLHAALWVLSWRFERRGVRWCGLDDEGARPGPEGGTLRVLVHPEDLDRAEHAVRAGNGIVVTRGPGDGHLWLLRDAVTGSIAQLLVSTRLGCVDDVEADRRAVRAVLRDRVGGAVPSVAAPDRFWLDVARLARRRGRPSAAEVRSLRARRGRLRAAASPLAEPVVADLDATQTVDGFLADLDQHVIPRRRAGGAATLARRTRPNRRIGLTVAVLDPDGLGEATAAAPPAWPWPVVTIDTAGPPRPWQVRRPGDGPLASYRRARRWQDRARDGALVLVRHHPYEAWLTQQPRGPRQWWRAAWAALLPVPDAVVLLERDVPTTTTHHRARAARPRRGEPIDSPSVLSPSPRCPVLTIDAGGSSARQRDELGRALWCLLSWSVVTSGLDR